MKYELSATRCPLNAVSKIRISKTYAKKFDR
jgi:hypothetical protein